MPSELTSDPEGRALLSWARRRACPDGLPEEGGPRLCHRLDRGSRGLVMIALNREVAAFHGANIAARRWVKIYLARIPAPRGEVLGVHRAYLRERAHRVEAVRAGGRPSSLEVLGCAPAPGRAGQAHALIRLHTGRRHQIRVMLAGLGLPLVGDALYGGAPGDLYLEHALLGWPGWPDGAPRRAWDPDDPAREDLDPGLRARLQALSEDTVNI